MKNSVPDLVYFLEISKSKKAKVEVKESDEEIRQRYKREAKSQAIIKEVMHDPIHRFGGDQIHP